MTDPTPPTAAELATWQAATDAATPGPWQSDPSADWGTVLYADIRVADFGDISASSARVMSKRDAAFVAVARSAMPRLLAEVARLNRECDEARRALVCDRCDHTGMRPEAVLGGSAYETRPVPCECGQRALIEKLTRMRDEA